MAWLPVKTAAGAFDRPVFAPRSGTPGCVGGQGTSPPWASDASPVKGDDLIQRWFRAVSVVMRPECLRGPGTRLSAQQILASRIDLVCNSVLVIVP